MALRDTVFHTIHANIFTTFQLCSGLFLWDFDKPRLISLLLAVFCDRSLRSTLKHLENLKNLKSLIGFLCQYPDCTFRQVQMAKTVSAQTQNLVERSTFRSRPLEEWLSVFQVISNSQPGKTCQYPQSDLAFYGSHSATIFLISPPFGTTPQQKYRLLHELGHMTYTSQVFNYRELVHALPMGGVFFWVYIQLPDSTLEKWIAIVIIGVLISASRIYPLLFGQEYADPDAELIADHFALANLSHDERVKYAEYVMKNFDRRFPPDQGLFFFMKRRSSAVKAALADILAHRDAELIYQHSPNLSSGKWLAGIGVIVVVAGLTSPVTQEMVKCMLIFGVAMSLIELYAWWKMFKASVIYKTLLKKRTLAPAPNNSRSSSHATQRKEGSP